MNGHEDDLTATRAELRREIGPPTDRDHKWQPMVSAGEVRALLDALDAADARDARVAADVLAPVLALLDRHVMFEAMYGSATDPDGILMLSVAAAQNALRAATGDPS